MNNQENLRGDSNCFKIMDRQNCQLLQKYLLFYHLEMDKV